MSRWSTRQRGVALGLVAWLALTGCGDSGDGGGVDPGGSGSGGGDDATIVEGDASVAMPDAGEQVDTDSPADTAGSVDVADSTVGADVADPAEDVGPPEECIPAAQTAPGIVVVEQGSVAGTEEGDTWAYKGIPYAAPPLGDLRWRPPGPPACFDGGFHAGSLFRSVCPQRDGATGQLSGNEDCLTLNVWVPKGDAPAGGWPIAAFIHGGSNLQGSSSDMIQGGTRIYDGRFLAGMGEVIVVTFNYRLGALGFFAHPDLTAESANGSSGNYGLMDQIAALDWVQSNIAAFGGDPGRVLLFGQSSGAADVCTLISSPHAAGQFHAAAMQSGGCGARPLELAEAVGLQRVEATTCAGDPDPIACLRQSTPIALVSQMVVSGSVADLELAASEDVFGPVIDGYVVPLSPLQQVMEMGHNQLPVILGTNGDEMDALVTTPVNSVADFEAAAETLLAPVDDELTAQIIEAYDPTTFETPRAALVQMMGDVRFTCPARAVARIFAQNQDAPVFRYLFSRRAVTPQGPRPATHKFELVFIFRTMTLIPGWTQEPEDLELSAQMLGYWARLASGGDPNGGDAPPWPEYDPDTDPYAVLDVPISSAAGLSTERCDLWESLDLADEP